MTERSDLATLSAVLREAANPALTLDDFSRAVRAAYDQMPRLADRIAIGADPLFACNRCLDVKTVPDWANWEPAWLWQRYRPVPRIACPDCSEPPRNPGKA